MKKKTVLKVGLATLLIIVTGVYIDSNSIEAKYIDNAIVLEDGEIRIEITPYHAFSTDGIYDQNIIITNKLETSINISIKPIYREWIYYVGIRNITEQMVEENRLRYDTKLKKTINGSTQYVTEKISNTTITKRK